MKNIEGWMIGTLVGIALLALTGALFAGPDDARERDAKAVEALVLTEKDDGKTIAVAGPGRVIEVRLEGERARTGWEANPADGKVLEREGAAPGERGVVAGAVFTPAKDATDKAIGTYAFRYRTVADGKSKLVFDYIHPGGPEVKERLRSARIRQVTFWIEVK